jgi:hypothetical protein
MNAASIKLGEEYAVKVYSPEAKIAGTVGVRINKRHQVTKVDSLSRKPTSKNYYSGVIISEPDLDQNLRNVEFEAKDVEMLFTEHEELVWKRKEQEAKEKAEEERLEGIRKDAVNLLSEVLGLPEPTPGRWGTKVSNDFVEEDYNGIEIKDGALPALCQLVFKAEHTLDAVQLADVRRRIEKEEEHGTPD